MRDGRGKRVSRFAQRLLREWERLEMPLKCERLVVAVSGGADSTALSLALHELIKAGRLGASVIVAHLDHGLRGEASKKDASWVEGLAKELGFRFELGQAGVRERAKDSADNLEQAARRARYEFLAEVAARHKALKILTGHTVDDQVETILLRLLRGSGAEGLSGMKPVRALLSGSDVLLVRPLLCWARRSETERYCRELEVDFRVDAMNKDENFARVRVRHQLLPLMETFNPRVVESLARTSQLLGEDAEFLNVAAEELLRAASAEETRKAGEDGASVPRPLSVKILVGARAAVRRRALRLWLACGRGDLRRLELVHLLAVEKLLEGERGGRVAELPGGSFVERRGARIHLHIN